ncbi:MAG: nucleotidyltransferase domain-containing protein [Bacillota bacterium]
MNKEKIASLVEEIIEQSEKIFGDSLCEVIIYGSYARGDYNSESDFDVMLLVKNDDYEIEKLHTKLVELSCDIQERYEVFLAIVAKNKQHFEQWSEHLPFYKNVNTEGKHYAIAA